ncbi:VOC family protein [Sinomonas sp. ASV322]|uniref:VOC family protein n=1 Tax=Sinomonas sp. ASV322 TaxID=3041920 RepID=UPI0027DBFE89|nr:VOC family protein [Sinomonas sp. ASV322]MDQ4504270.1 VOC family protein [Sinomonas sp. ASV322]
MINGVALMCLRVLDLDEAKTFYVEKLGFDVAMDTVMDGFRWLVVTIPGEPPTPMMLVEPGAPLMDEASAEHMREAIARGYYGLGALKTDDCRATYAELASRGVEFTEEPHERFYGVDAAFRDPSGNYWRLTQPKPVG